jgi:hypothetical protein
VSSLLFSVGGYRPEGCYVELKLASFEIGHDPEGSDGSVATGQTLSELKQTMKAFACRRSVPRKDQIAVVIRKESTMGYSPQGTDSRQFSLRGSSGKGSSTCSVWPSH